MPTEAYIYDAIRTPRGRGKANGSLHEVRPLDLLKTLFDEMRLRHDLDTAQVDDVLLGCVMDELSMILLTIPIFFPMIMGLDFGMNPEETAIWFGILVLIVVEVGLITPPVGMNLFVINSMAKDTPIVQTYRGVTPFVISDLVRTAILAAFPAITLIALRMTS